MTRDAARYSAEDLRRFMSDVMVHYGMGRDDADFASTNLVDADLSGIDTHGISNFVTHWHYAPGLRDGAVRARPQPEVLRESPVSLALDADRGFGPLVLGRAMKTTIAKAEASGMCMATIRDGCHFGAAGTYARMAAEAGMIGIVACHTAPSTVLPGTNTKITGTNPFAVAAPAGASHPFVLDMATTVVAGTKLQVAARQGDQIPEGWAVDVHGQPITNPAEWASLLPLGTGDDMGYKGVGLALVVDILSGIMSGTGPGVATEFGPEWRQGVYLSAWRVDAFVDPQEFENGMHKMRQTLRDAVPLDGHQPGLVPGDRQAATRAERSVSGVPLQAEVLERIEAVATETQIPFPEALSLA